MVDQPVTNVVTPTASNPPLATPLTFAGPIRLEDALETATAAGLAPSSVSPDFQGGRLQTWNVNIERQLGTAAGRHGRLLRVEGRPPAHLAEHQPAGQRRAAVPVPVGDSPIMPGAPLGNIVEINSVGLSSYHGLWISANQRLTSGLQFTASYTLSKSLDYNSLNSQGVIVQDSYDIANSRGLSDYDARHRFVANVIYELPFTGNAFAEGWQIAAIVQAPERQPAEYRHQQRRVQRRGQHAQARSRRLSGDHRRAIPVVRQQRLRPADLRLVHVELGLRAARLRQRDVPFRRSGRNVVIGPGFTNVDFSLTKRTPLGSSARLEFRLEAFNLFNHPNFGQPGRIAAVGSTSFGVITTTRFPTGDSGSARQIQLAAKVLF